MWQYSDIIVLEIDGVMNTGGIKNANFNPHHAEK